MKANVRVLAVKTTGAVKAAVSATLDLDGGGKIFLNDMAIKAGRNGLWLDMPQKKVKKVSGEEEWKKYFFLSKEVQQELQKKALAEFGAKDK